ncbi:MAG: hypothetical protein JSV62_01675 [Promethearchaeota archaeon]|nr:MAG: hypothetical protein JSV62_01675 [Candidatus Lokiarchaeota archaeon]
MSLEVINKNKIRADDYISIFLVILYLIFAVFFLMEAILSMIIYPFASLAIWGVLKIIGAFNKRNTENYGKLNKLLFGIISIVSSILFLYFLLNQPNITPHIIISLIAFPMIIVAFAGIIKGMIIDIYSLKYRVMNIIIGIITLVFSLIGFFYLVDNFLFNLITISLTLLVNIISRAALYLSEFGLSIMHFKNFKLFLYIISDYILYIDMNGDIILSKIE